MCQGNPLQDLQNQIDKLKQEIEALQMCLNGIAKFRFADDAAMIDRVSVLQGIATESLEYVKDKIYASYYELQTENTDLRESLRWLVTDAKARFDDCRENLEPGSQGGYSPELRKAMELVGE